MLGLLSFVAPFRLLRSATESGEETSEASESENVEENVNIHEEEVVYTENSSSSQLRQRKSGKRKMAVDETDAAIVDDYDEGMITLISIDALCVCIFVIG